MTTRAPIQARRLASSLTTLASLEPSEGTETIGEYNSDGGRKT